MAIVEGQKVNVKWSGKMANHYESKGYPKLKHNEEFFVSINDLTPSSNKGILVLCDVCKIKTVYRKFNQAKKSETHYCSKECEKNESKHSKEFLIQEYYRFFNENGRYPLYEDLQVKNGYPSYYYYLKSWGSWNVFIDELGIKEEGRWLKEDVETLKKMYCNFSKEEIQNALINKFSWEHIKQKANSYGLKRKRVIPNNIKYTKEYLIKEFWRFFTEFGKYPLQQEIGRQEGFPSEFPYTRIWKSWSNFLKEIGVVDIDNSDGWYKHDEDILRKYYSEGDKQFIIDSLMVKRKWGVIVKKANSLGLNRNMDKANYSKKRMSKEFLIQELQRYFNTYKKVPTHTEMEENKGFPSPKVFQKRFGTWNKALKSAGLEVNIETEITKEEIILRATEFFNLNNRSPYWNEIGISRGVYERHWDNFPSMLLEANLPLNKKTRIDHFKTDEELIKDYVELYNTLGRIPIANDINIRNGMASFSTYKSRFGGYKEIWEKCGIENKTILDETMYGFICLDKNGEICKSYAELVITNLFIDNNIKYVKEYKYEDLIPSISEKYVMDWYLLDYKICVEFFGIFKEDEINKKGRVGEYSRKTKNKIKIAKENDITLIDLYQKDLNQTYLQRLVKKFNNYNIHLNVGSKNLYKNNFNKSSVV